MSISTKLPTSPRTTKRAETTLGGASFHLRSPAALCMEQRALRSAHGAIAQLGERLHGMQEVRGSIPLGSTKLRECRLLARLTSPIAGEACASLHDLG
jgi:hypothetical protein